MDTIAEIPEDLRKEIEEENKKYAEDKAEYQRKMDTLDLRVFYGNTSIMIHINKFQTLRDAKVKWDAASYSLILLVLIVLLFVRNLPTVKPM